MRNFTLLLSIAMLVLSSYSNIAHSQVTSSRNGTYGNNILTEKPNTPINDMINGYIEVLPVGYNDPANADKKYPLLIYFEGQSEFGDGGESEILLLYGHNDGALADIIADGDFLNSYTAGGVPGETFNFIVIIPQVRAQAKHRPQHEEMANPQEVDDVINYAFQKYRVDEDRVYLSGYSIGGGTAWNYPGESETYANKIAALVTFVGASIPDATRINNIANTDLPVWTFVNSGDNDQNNIDNATNYINGIHADPDYDNDANAILTIFDRGAGEHDAWTAPLLGKTWDASGNMTDIDLNIYEWMLQFSRNNAAPVLATVTTSVSPNPLQLPDGSLNLEETDIVFTGGTVTLSATVTPASTATEWVRVNGNGGTITNPTNLTTTVTGLEPGSYSYQLRATNADGSTSLSSVSFQVLKPADATYLKVEAETGINKIGGGGDVDNSYTDNGPATVLRQLDANTSVDYTLHLPSAGKYALYLRYSTGDVHTVTIINGTETRQLTLRDLDDVWTSDSVELVFETNEPTITIKAGSTGGWSLNYLELVQLSVENPLPVNFSLFNAHCENGVISLMWKTAQEQNSKRFSVQRIVGNQSWKEVASLTAAGQSETERTYTYKDNSASSGGLYRIVEYDFDGRTTISSIVKADCNTASQLTVYPNPTTGDAVLRINLQRAQKMSVWVFDSKGATVYQRVYSLPAGTTALPLSTSAYARGIYTIKLNYDGQIETVQLLRK